MVSSTDGIGPYDNNDYNSDKKCNLEWCRLPTSEDCDNVCEKTCKTEKRSGQYRVHEDDCECCLSE